jgi:hypothetical protein
MLEQELKGEERRNYTENAINRLSSYLQIHMIEIESFWKTNRI